MRRCAVLFSAGTWRGPVTEGKPHGVPSKVVDDHSAARDLKQAMHRTPEGVVLQGTSRRRHLRSRVLDRLTAYEHLGVKIGTRTFSIALTILSNARLKDPCEAVFAKMRAKGLRPDVAVFNMMLKVCAASGDPATAQYYWDLLNDSAPLRPDAVSHVTYLKALVGHVHSDELMSVARRTIDAISAGKGPETRRRQEVAVLTIVLPGLPSRSAFKVMRDVMCDPSLVPDVRFFTAVLSACSQPPGDAVGAAKVEEALKASGLLPDTRYFNALLRVYRSTGDFDACKATLARFDEARLLPDVTTYNHTIATCAAAAAGDASSAPVQLACLAFEAALRQGLGEYSTLFMGMLELHHSTGDRHAAEEIVRRLRQFGHHRGSRVCARLKEMKLLPDKSS